MTPPLTREQWLVVRMFREALGLTYKQVGDVLGKSPSLVKQYVNDSYEFYRTPSGHYARRKRRGGERPAHPVESADAGG